MGRARSRYIYVLLVLSLIRHSACILRGVTGVVLQVCGGQLGLSLLVCFLAAGVFTDGNRAQVLHDIGRNRMGGVADGTFDFNSAGLRVLSISDLVLFRNER